MKRYCTHCGKEIPEGDSFCPYCGAPADKEDIPEEPEPSQNPKSPKKFPFWILIVVIALVIGTAAFFIGRSSSSKDTETTAEASKEPTEKAETSEPEETSTPEPVETDEPDMMDNFRNAAEAQNSADWYGMTITLPPQNQFKTAQNDYLNGLKQYVNVDQFFGNHLNYATDSDYINFHQNNGKNSTDVTATIIEFDSAANASDWLSEMNAFLSSCQQKQITTDGRNGYIVFKEDSGSGFWYEEQNDSTSNRYFDVYSISDNYVMLESSYINVSTTNPDEMRDKMFSFRQAVGFN